MKLLVLTIMATILSACPLSDLALVETHPYAAEVKGQGEKSYGTRSFREINQTMSRVTGIDSQREAIRTTYQGVVEMLPRDNAIDSFSGPVQVGIVRLASEYCNQMAYNRELVKKKFPEFDLGSIATSVLVVEKRSQIASLFIDAFWGQTYRTSDDGQRAVAELVDLIDQEMLDGVKRRMTTTTGTNRMLLRNIFISLCATSLASAPLMFF